MPPCSVWRRRKYSSSRPILNSYPAVRARCVEVQLQLQVEAKGLEAIRHATREIMALFVEKEDPERAAAIRRNEVEVELDLLRLRLLYAT